MKTVSIWEFCADRNEYNNSRQDCELFKKDGVFFAMKNGNIIFEGEKQELLIFLQYT